MKLPNKIKLANLPTPIFPFDPLKQDIKNLYIKRDDFTGSELSGNKIRKLEYCLCDAIEKNANVIITCGGVQSNHCRATASAAAMLGLKCHLLLTGDESDVSGNYLLDKLFGAEINFVSNDDYTNNRNSLMNDIKKSYEKNGDNAYIIPMGASSGMGMFGYFDCFKEIQAQEKEMGIIFDTIVVAEGSAGTYAGLYAANEIYKAGKNIVSINIYDKTNDMKKEVHDIITEGFNIVNEPMITMDNILTLTEYAWEGYGKTAPYVVDFIKTAAQNTGIAFDPVYTGKALHGLIKELSEGNPMFKGNVLFIHTGGLIGLFPKKSLFF